MELTANNVETIFMDCLFADATNVTEDDATIVDAVMNKIGFDPAKVETHRDTIKELLKQLPD